MNRFLSLWAMVCRKPEGEGAEGSAAPPDFSAFADVLGSGVAAPGEVPPADKGAGEDSGGTGAGATPAAAAPAPAQADGNASQPTQPAAPPEVPQPGPAPTEGQTDPQADLQRQVAEFLAKAQPKAEVEVEAKPSPPPAAPQSPEATTPASSLGYNFQVPDQMVEALGSDDLALRKAALTGLVNGLAARLSQDFSKALVELTNYVKTQVPQEVIGQVEQRQTFEGMKKDLYQTFPQIRQLAAMPGVEGAIWQQIRAVGTQMGQKDWTPEFRDGVGRMILLNAGLPVAPAAQAPAPAQAQAQPQRSPRSPSFSAGGQGGSRSNGASGQANEFMDLLNAGSG